MSGDVDIDIEIDVDGRVSSAVPVAGPMVLRAAALSAVRQWRYEPATTDGIAIAERRRVRVSFQ